MFYFIFHHLYWVCSLRVLLWSLNRFNQLLFSRREKVSLNPVKSRLCVVPGPGKSSPRIGYIKLTSFNQNASGKWTWVVTSLAGCISCLLHCSRTFTCLQGLKPHWIGKRGKNYKKKKLVSDKWIVCVTCFHSLKFNVWWYINCSKTTWSTSPNMWQVLDFDIVMYFASLINKNTKICFFCLVFIYTFKGSFLLFLPCCSMAWLNNLMDCF